MASVAEEAVRRTRLGVEALAGSVLAARSEPERLGYLAAGELTVWAKLFGWRRLHSALKPTLLPLLAGTVLRADAAAGEKATLLAGLTAGWLGDVEKTRTPARASVPGFAGVAGQHAAYSRALLGRGARASGSGAVLRGAVWAAGVGLSARKRRQLVPAVTIAGAAVTVTSTLADDRDLQDGSTARQGLGHGANLVLVSEGLTLLRSAVFTKDNALGRVIDAGTAATSFFGHLLLVDGLARK
ncbi:lysoplasmalogenase family protein [Corynebacterium halotolerans]|uniref:Lysoplasmalogenase n=1 Tax=Corynebacterium halotolerans YIM 70093 = DSM 44683 TaxID=1121362 RepID=M1P3W8_9CORY|nr:lysoplasmalogenase family protein [Corynebacterium halotolerans]AGF71366.1 hypothetical protein A605_01760 [Corynebacterium halotolerans YIM 70093 = DSM 44683]